MLLWLFSPEFSPPSGRGSYISLVSCRNGGEWIKCLTCFLTLMEKYVWKTSNLTKLSALGWQFVATSFVCTFVAVIKCPLCIHGVLKRVNPLYNIFSIQNNKNLIVSKHISDSSLFTRIHFHLPVKAWTPPAQYRKIIFFTCPTNWRMSYFLPWSLPQNILHS